MYWSFIIVFIYLSVPMIVLLQEVHWDLKSLQLRRKVMTMRNRVQAHINIGSTYVARKLSEYLQLNHIACAGLFGGDTSIFLCIILCSRYYLPLHFPAFSWYTTLCYFTNFFWDLRNIIFQQVIGLWRLVNMLPDHQAPLCFWQAILALWKNKFQIHAKE